MGLEVASRNDDGRASRTRPPITFPESMLTGEPATRYVPNMLLAGCTPDNSLADFAVTTQQTNGTRPRQPRSTFQADWLFHRGEWKPIDDPLPEGIDFEKQLTAAGFTESHKSETSCPFVEIFRSERGKAPYQFCVVFGDFGEQWGTVYINDLPSLLQLMQMAGPLMLLDQMYADYFSRERADR